MATVSNAFSGSTMSNAQAGTRGLSSGDWIRLKRLRGVGKGGWNKATSNNALPPQNTYNKAMLIPKRTGSSKYQNMSSDWTNFKAYNTADYVLQTQQSGNVGKTLVAQKLCSCLAVPYSPKKQGACVKCKPAAL